MTAALEAGSLPACNRTSSRNWAWMPTEIPSRRRTRGGNTTGAQAQSVRSIIEDATRDAPHISESAPFCCPVLRSSRHQSEIRETSTRQGWYNMLILMIWFSSEMVLLCWRVSVGA